VAYKLMPQQAPLLLTAPDSSVTKRGAFATKHLWVTPHSDDGARCAAACCTALLLLLLLSHSLAGLKGVTTG
jgi:hypothetical protein